MCTGFDDPLPFRRLVCDTVSPRCLPRLAVMWKLVSPSLYVAISKLKRLLYHLVKVDELETAVEHFVQRPHRSDFEKTPPEARPHGFVTAFGKQLNAISDERTARWSRVVFLSLSRSQRHVFCRFFNGAGINASLHLHDQLQQPLSYLKMTSCPIRPKSGLRPFCPQRFNYCAPSPIRPTKPLQQ